MPWRSLDEVWRKLTTEEKGEGGRKGSKRRLRMREEEGGRVGERERGGRRRRRAREGERQEED